MVQKTVVVRVKGNLVVEDVMLIKVTAPRVVQVRARVVVEVMGKVEKSRKE